MRTALFLMFNILILPPCLAIGGGAKSGGPVTVRGYVKSNGTYVQPHMRSAPDGSFSNNWSTAGNINPYTGNAGAKIAPPIPSPNAYNAPERSSMAGKAEIIPMDDTDYQKVEPETNKTIEMSEAYRSDRPKLPPHAKLNYLGNDWECIRGFYRAEQECVAVSPPANAKLNYLGNGWECVHGYRQAGQVCVAIDLPVNAKMNYLGNGWECQHGYRQTGQECVAVQVPVNAKLNYLGNGWECRRGFRQAGPECVAVQIPLNAQLDYLGNRWECVRGYTQSGQECLAVRIPANAKLNYLGNGWECQPGYRQSGSECAAVR